MLSTGYQVAMAAVLGVQFSSKSIADGKDGVRSLMRQKGGWVGGWMGALGGARENEACAVRTPPFQQEDVLTPPLTLLASLPACVPAGAIAMLETVGLAQDALDVLQQQGWEALLQVRAARKGVRTRLPWMRRKPTEEQQQQEQLQMEEGKVGEEEEEEEGGSADASGRRSSKQGLEAVVLAGGEAGGQLAAAQAAGDLQAAAGGAAEQPTPQLQVGMQRRCCWLSGLALPCRPCRPASLALLPT